MKLEEFKSKAIEKIGDELLRFYLDLFKQHDLLYERSVQDLLWGYKDPILEIFKLIGLTDNATFALEVRAL